MGQISYMRDPDLEQNFAVGDKVEVYCDHEDEKGKDRVRGWIKGVVVQVDNNKMVAVQFRINVFLTDGWMVPDRILWFPVTSEHIRHTGRKAKVLAAKKNDIPDY
ncbi:MAG: hypothetical protein Kow002_19490 [Anaerolineales bacterium]